MRLVVMYVIFLLLFLLTNPVVGQDFDIYPRLKDDNVKVPDLYEKVTFEEFKVLSRDIRMMDMPYSLIVPGYIHFKAGDKTMGYTMVGLRLAGYTGLAVTAIRVSQLGHRATDIVEGKDNLKADRDIFIASSVLIIGSWLFDWIHGKYRLEKKQELIRYKYAVKFRLEKQFAKPTSSIHYAPGIMLTLNF